LFWDNTTEIEIVRGDNIVFIYLFKGVHVSFSFNMTSKWNHENTWLR